MTIRQKLEIIQKMLGLKVNFVPAIIRQEQKHLYYTYLLKAQTKNDHSQNWKIFCAMPSWTDLKFWSVEIQKNNFIQN